MKMHYQAKKIDGVKPPRALCGTWYPRNAVERDAEHAHQVDCKRCIRKAEKSKRGNT